MTVLVTGAAGFIGSFVCQRLLQTGHQVVGVDNLNNYYDVSLKQKRLELLNRLNFHFIKQDIVNGEALAETFSQYPFETVIHLAAEAGVTYGADHPELFMNTNVVGFGHVLENCRRQKIRHLIYASTAAVYGDNKDFQVTENSASDQPLTMYAATKKANEVLAHCYAEQFDLRVTGLRFFTVYGPWARPDMALYKFARQIVEQQPIHLHNHGNHTRDLIYIDDLVDAIEAVIAQPEAQQARLKHRIYNLGHEKAVGLQQMVSELESCLGQQTEHIGLQLQRGEVKDNKADATAFYRDYGIKPKVGFHEGVAKFVQWYREYHQQ